MKKIFAILLITSLVGCFENREVPYRVKDCVNQEIEVHHLDSGYRVNDTVTLRGYAYKYVILERVK
jgi:hypothetical protein